MTISLDTSQIYVISKNGILNIEHDIYVKGKPMHRIT